MRMNNTKGRDNYSNGPHRGFGEFFLAKLYIFQNSLITSYDKELKIHCLVFYLLPPLQNVGCMFTHGF
jgi:hypothetical protein